MRSYVRLHIAVVVAAAVAVLLTFYFTSEFPVLSGRFMRLGLPIGFALLLLIAYGISSLLSANAIIYSSLLTLLLLALMPFGTYWALHKVPSYYYLDPQGRIILSTFPGYYFEDRPMLLVNEEVLAAENWQRGNRTDPSGKPLRFYRERQNGEITIFDHPIDHGEVLRPLTYDVWERYQSQQLDRAETLMREGYLGRSKEIAESILGQNSANDAAFMLLESINRRIREQEEAQAQAEAARIAAEQAAIQEAEARAADNEVLTPSVQITESSEPPPQRRRVRRQPRRTPRSNELCICPPY